MINLGTLGGSSAYAFGINNIGQIVGGSLTGSGDEHAFLYSGGSMSDLNNLVALPPGVFLFQASGINDVGQIAANGTDGHGYLLTPGYQHSRNRAAPVRERLGTLSGEIPKLFKHPRGGA